MLERLFPVLTPHPREGRKPPPHPPSPRHPLIPYRSQLCAVIIRGSVPWRSSDTTAWTAIKRLPLNGGSGPRPPFYIDSETFDSWWLFENLSANLENRFILFSFFVESQLVAVAAGRVTQSLVHKQECIVGLKAMGSISVFQSGF